MNATILKIAAVPAVLALTSISVEWGTPNLNVLSGATRPRLPATAPRQNFEVVIGSKVFVLIKEVS